MNNWTISRRIIAGFVTLVVFAVALGAFALWRLTGLAQDIRYLADNSIPTVLTLSEAANVSRDNLISLLQIDEGATERNTQLEEKITANAGRRDILLKNYEAMISDEEDRRLFEDVKRARDIMIASRSRAVELMKENKPDESRKMQQEVVIPDHEKFLKAIDLDI